MTNVEKAKTFLSAAIKSTMIVPVLGLVAHFSVYCSDDCVADYSLKNRFECAYKINVAPEKKKYRIVSEFNGHCNVDVDKTTSYLASPWATYPAHVLLFVLGGRSAVMRRKNEEEYNRAHPWAKILNGRGR